LKSKICGKKEEVEEFSYIELYKTETLLGGGVYGVDLIKFGNRKLPTSNN
jgi:hypothetical protein